MRAPKTASEFLRIRAQTPIIFITLAISADLSCSLHPRSDDLAAERRCYPVLLVPAFALVRSMLAPDQTLNGYTQRLFRLSPSAPPFRLLPLFPSLSLPSQNESSPLPQPDFRAMSPPL